MHIQHITLDLRGGGSFRALSNIILNDINNDHSVIALRSYGESYKLIEKKCKYIMNLTLENPILDLIRLIKFTLKAKPDVIQTWLYYCDLLGACLKLILRSKKLVWNIRCTLSNKKQFKFTTNLTIQICAILSYFFPDKIISCSKKSYIDHSKIGYFKKKFKVIQNGVDTNVFYPNECLRNSFRKDFKLNNDDFILGMVARYDEQKDHKTLLEALSICKNKGYLFKCFLIGSEIDSSNKALTKHINKFQLRNDIILCGIRKDLNYFYNGFDFHVLSSKSEGSPNVTLEAMASGTPCITTDNGDSREIVSNSGWVCPTDNPMKLAESIEMAFNETNENLVKRKNNAIITIKNYYSIQKMVKEYEKIYKGIYLKS